jgi:hypothetical protein
MESFPLNATGSIRLLRRCPWGVIGMIGIIAGVESFIARHPAEFTDPSAYSWTLSMSALRTQARSAEILCLGDSLVKHGLLPEVITERLGKSTYNLAICAAPPPAQYYLLRHALDAGARPKSIIVDFNAGLLAGSPSFETRYWPEMLSYRELVELALNAREFQFFVDASLADLLPSHRNRWEIRNKVMDLLDGREDKLRLTNLAVSRNWGLHRGAEFSGDNLAFRGELTEAEHVRHLSNKFWCARINREYLRRFLDLATSRGIEVFWLLPPVSPAVQQRRIERGADKAYTQFVRGIVAKHPSVVVLDARYSGYDHTKFVDAIHLNGKGGVALSSDVADAISSRTSAWVTLPPYRDRSPKEPLEDFEQSKLAVRADLARAIRR